MSAMRGISTLLFMAGIFPATGSAQSHGNSNAKPIPPRERAKIERCYIEGKIDPKSRLRESRMAADFVRTLNYHHVQDRLRELYDIDGETLARLYRLAFGILGNETQYGSSPKYWFKERFPWLIPSVKGFKNQKKKELRHVKALASDVSLGIIHESLALRNDYYDRDDMLPILFDVSMNSRGLTQIKYFPEKLKEAFPFIAKGDLSEASSAAIATVAYLAESLPRLRYLAKKHNCKIPEDTFIEHSVYLYSGRAHEIVNCTATLQKNLYYQGIERTERDVEFRRSPGCLKGGFF